MPCTLAAPASHEIDKVKGSRFLAFAAPIDHEADADALLADLRARFPDATHHCLAWRLTDDRYRYSDDGEPNNTAGRPIFNQIVGHDLYGVAVVVVRWFGGTKLGTGGLVRAYGAAAAAVLDSADIVTWRETSEVRVRFAYTDQGAVDAVLHAFDVEVTAQEFAADVTLVVRLDAERARPFTDALVERTGGRAEIG